MLDSLVSYINEDEAFGISNRAKERLEEKYCNGESSIDSCIDENEIAIEESKEILKCLEDDKMKYHFIKRLFLGHSIKASEIARRNMNFGIIKRLTLFISKVCPPEAKTSSVSSRLLSGTMQCLIDSYNGKIENITSAEIEELEILVKVLTMITTHVLARLSMKENLDAFEKFIKIQLARKEKCSIEDIELKSILGDDYHEKITPQVITEGIANEVKRLLRNPKFSKTLNKFLKLDDKAATEDIVKIFYTPTFLSLVSIANGTPSDCDECFEDCSSCKKCVDVNYDEDSDEDSDEDNDEDNDEDITGSLLNSLSNEISKREMDLKSSTGIGLLEGPYVHKGIIMIKIPESQGYFGIGINIHKNDLNAAMIETEEIFTLPFSTINMVRMLIYLRRNGVIRFEDIHIDSELLQHYNVSLSKMEETIEKLKETEYFNEICNSFDILDFVLLITLCIYTSKEDENMENPCKSLKNFSKIVEKMNNPIDFKNIFLPSLLLKSDCSFMSKSEFCSFLTRFFSFFDNMDISSIVEFMYKKEHYLKTTAMINSTIEIGGKEIDEMVDSMPGIFSMAPYKTMAIDSALATGSFYIRSIKKDTRFTIATIVYFQDDITTISMMSFIRAHIKVRKNFTTGNIMYTVSIIGVGISEAGKLQFESISNELSRLITIVGERPVVLTVPDVKGSLYEDDFMKNSSCITERSMAMMSFLKSERNRISKEIGVECNVPDSKLASASFVNNLIERVVEIGDINVIRKVIDPVEYKWFNTDTLDYENCKMPSVRFIISKKK